MIVRVLVFDGVLDFFRPLCGGTLQVTNNLIRSRFLYDFSGDLPLGDLSQFSASSLWLVSAIPIVRTRAGS
jgi:hypothetical protein